MTDYCLGVLGGAGPLSVEGSFTANPWFGRLLAALRPQQAVSYSDDGSGTTYGAWLLRYRDGAPPGTVTAVPPVSLAGLVAYRARWLSELKIGKTLSPQLI